MSLDLGVVRPAAIGTIGIKFSGAKDASVRYTVGGRRRTVSILGQLSASGATELTSDYTGLWWNPNDSGLGIAVAQLYDVMFITCFVYDGAGGQVWYVVSDRAANGDDCAGALHETSAFRFDPRSTPRASPRRGPEPPLDCSGLNNGHVHFCAGQRALRKGDQLASLLADATCAPARSSG